jgi:crotonobetainyl-CoA:carnitine CoA-transferase CaiB-like acyl-CoA transferase
MGHSEWALDERFANLMGLALNGPELVPEVREIIAAHDLAHWSAEFDGAGLIWAPVAQLPDVIEDPSLREAGAFAIIEHPTAGAMETVAAPFDIRGADIAVRGPAPGLGQHSREVFEEVGISAERLDDLVARGVVVAR